MRNAVQNRRRRSARTADHGKRAPAMTRPTRPSPSPSPIVPFAWFALSLAIAAAAAATGAATAGDAAAAYAGDPIRDARCFAKCQRRISSERPQCYSGCLQNERWIKPGECPVGDLDSGGGRSGRASGGGVAVSLDRPCLEQCGSDDFCRGEYKCCRHSCGITCQPPVGLADSPGLPDEPSIVAVSDYGKTLTVEWSPPDPGTAAAGHVTYVLQERHHVGVAYVPERMTEWSTVARTDKTREPLKQPPYAPGRWFQFRVAAINGNGTRGFSAPSQPFFAELGPHVDAPGPPQNLMVSSLKWTNQEYQQCVLSWTPPAASVLPVRKYKLSVIVRDGPHVYHKRHEVPADISRFPIKKLNPNSEYFLQVQAISEFGRKRYAGKKASITLRTKGEKKLSSKKITDIRVVSVEYEYVDGYKTGSVCAGISWRPIGVTSRKFLYAVSWTPMQDCDDEGRELRERIAIPYFDLCSLNRLCKYLIEISASYKGSRHVGSIIFTPPPSPL